MRGAFMLVLGLLCVPLSADAQAFFDGTDTQKPVTLVVESNTYTPYFYNGRAVPIEGSEMRVIAHTASNAAVSYEWMVNNVRMDEDGPVITFVTPLAGTLLIGVTARDGAGGVLGSDQRFIPFAEPEVHFYEHNPLRGISRVTISDQHVFASSESTVRAEPYYMSNPQNTDAHRIRWRVNGSTVEPNSDPFTLTLQSDAVGRFRIDFEIINTQILTQVANGSFNVRL